MTAPPPGQDPQKEAQHGSPGDRPGAVLPVLLCGQEALEVRFEDLPLDHLFDVQQHFGDAEEPHDDRHQSDPVEQFQLVERKTRSAR